MIRNFLKLSINIFLLCQILSAKADDIVVDAAASLSISITEIANLFEQKTSHRVRLNFASSSVLARQIEYGARSDIFISANGKWVDYLKEKGKLSNNSIDLLLSNTLVVAVPSDFDNNFVKELKQVAVSFELENDSLANTISNKKATDKVDNRFMQLMRLVKQSNQHLIIADTSHVPLGEYSKQALESINMFEELESQLIPTSNARSALAFLEQAQANVAILYSSDANGSNRVKIINSIPEKNHAPILYYLAKTQSIRESTTAVDDFYQFLLSPQAQVIFKQNGFSLIDKQMNMEQ